MYQFFVNTTGCATAADTFECLRSAPSDVLQQANQDVIQVPAEWKGPDQGPVVLGPVLAPGDDFLPKLPSVSIHAGHYAKAPFINGDVKDKGTVFIDQTTPQTDKNVTDWLLYQAPGLYFGINNKTAVKEPLKTATADGVNAWSYFFNQSINSLDPTLDSWGVQHIVENTFMFSAVEEFLHN
ncbi:hypothetical protein RSAG8_13541, partial [Rhizoctonia solani AG-8 WAC10335]